MLMLEKTSVGRHLPVWAWVVHAHMAEDGYLCGTIRVCSYLLASLALIRLFSAVDTLVSLQMVALDKPHITHVTSKRLLP